MVWIIVAFALVLAFGPVLYFLPTRRERRLAAIRLEARRQGLVVELKAVRKLDAAPEERVSAGGERRAPVHDSVSYALPLRAGLERIRPWRLLRSEQHGWQIDSDLPEPPEPTLLAELRLLLDDLPDDAVALELGGAILACYWLERFPADGDTVEALKVSLAAIARKLAAMDAELTRERFDPDA